MKFLDSSAQTNWKFVAIVAAIGVVAAAGTLLLGDTISPPAAQTLPFAPSPQPRGEVLDTSTWQTYRNAEYGFEVKYPKGWRQLGADSGSSQNLFSVSTREGYQGVLGILGIKKFLSVERKQSVEELKEGRYDSQEIAIGEEVGVESGGIICEVARPCAVRFDYESTELAQRGFGFYLVLESVDSESGVTQ